MIQGTSEFSFVCVNQLIFVLVHNDNPNRAGGLSNMTKPSIFYLVEFYMSFDYAFIVRQKEMILKRTFITETFDPT